MKTQQIQFSIHTLWWDRTVAPSPNPFLQSQKQCCWVLRLAQETGFDTQMYKWLCWQWPVKLGGSFWLRKPIRQQWDEFRWECRKLLLTLSRALGAFSCCVKGLSYHVNSHGVRLWSYFFSLTLFLLHLNCSASLVFLWVVSSNFCSPKSKQCSI